MYITDSLSNSSRGLTRIHPGEVSRFVDALRLERLQPMHPEFFFLFSLSIRPSGVVVNNQYCHVLPSVIATIKMGSYRQVLFGSDGGPVVVDPSAEVCGFSYVLFVADITTDEIDAVICFAGEVPQNLVTATCHRTAESLSVRAILA